MSNSQDRKPVYGQVQNELCPESPTSIPHNAVLIDLINVGPLETTDINGKKKTAHHIVWVFQVFPQDDSRQSNGQPFYFSRDATTSMFPGSTSMSPSITYQIVTGMRPEPFKNPQEAAKYDLNQLIGKPCRLNIVHKNGFPQFSKDTTEGNRGVEPFVDDSGKFITDKSQWPQPEYEYYVPEEIDAIVNRLTNPDRFKTKEQREGDQQQAQVQAAPVSNNPAHDDAIPF